MTCFSRCALQTVLISTSLVALSAVARADSLFVDPSHYTLYNCDQLNKAHKAVGDRLNELQGLMAKAETGFAGKLMSGLAYESDYVATRGELDQIEENRTKNNCGPLPADKLQVQVPIVEKKPRKKRDH